MVCLNECDFESLNFRMPGPTRAVELRKKDYSPLYYPTLGVE
jgi:hypothetical protein